MKFLAALASLIFVSPSFADIAQPETLRVELGESSTDESLTNGSILKAEDVVIIPTEKTRPTRSQFFFLPADGDISAKIYYSNLNLHDVSSSPDYWSSERTAGEASVNTTGFEFSRSFNRHLYFQLDLAYAHTHWTSVTDIITGSEETRADSKGLRDFKFNIIANAKWDRFTLLYGGDVNWSPQAKTLATSVREGNSFSGETAFNTYVGFEYASNKGIWGSRLNTTVWKQTTYRDYDDNTTHLNEIDLLFNVDGFYEFPIASFLDLGVLVGFGHRSGDSIMGNGLDTRLSSYAGRVYTNFHFIKDTNFELSAGASSQGFEDSKTTTDLTFALRRIL